MVEYFSPKKIFPHYSIILNYKKRYCYLLKNAHIQNNELPPKDNKKGSILLCVESTGFL